jgi:WD40 repeat protein
MRRTCLIALLVGAVAAPAWSAPAPEDKPPEGKEVRRIEWPGNHVFWTGFSPDGRMYFGGGDTGTIRVWDVASGKQLQEFPGSVGTITPDSQSLLVMDGKALHLYDLDKGKETRKWDLSDTAVTLAVSRDGKQVATGHTDKAVRVWDFATGKEVRKLEGHEAPPSVVFSPDGKQLLSAAEDRTVRLWDLGTGKEVRRFEGFKDETARPGQGLLVEASFVAGGRVVGHVWGRKSFLIVWEAATGKEVKRLDLGADHHKDIAVSPDGRWLLSGHEDHTVRLRDLTTGKEVKRLAVPDVYVPRALNFSPSGRYAVAGSHRGRVFLWQMRN